VAQGHHAGGLPDSVAMDNKQKRLLYRRHQQAAPILTRKLRHDLSDDAIRRRDPVDPSRGSPRIIQAARLTFVGRNACAFAPDGFLYVGNGARTDAGQTWTNANW